MSKQTFLMGALILTLANLLVRAMGFCYQIIVVRLIGTEGIGIFNMIYPLYIAAIVITTLGLPLAVSKYTAEDMAKNRIAQTEKTLGAAVSILLLISGLFSFLLIWVSPYLIKKIYTDPRVIPSFLILIPTLMLIAVSSCLRGFFQGSSDMRPTAAAQLVEQIIRFASGIPLVYFLAPLGLIWASVSLSAGIFLSEVGGLLLLVIIYKKTTRRKKLVAFPSLPILTRLFGFGIPVTATKIVSTLVGAIEASLIPRQLIKAGSTIGEATAFFGELTGVAFTLLNVPSTLSYSLATTLVPATSEAQSKKQKAVLNQRTTDAVSITLLAGIPCALILFFWGPALATRLFHVNHAGDILQILALGAVFLYLAQTTSGILQGLGCVKTIFATTSCAGFLRLSGIYYFGAHPILGTSGIALSYAASFICLAVLNLTVIKGLTGFSLEGSFFLRMSIAGLALCSLLQFLGPYVINSTLYLVCATFLLMLVFFLILLLTGDKYTILAFRQLLQTFHKVP